MTGGTVAGEDARPLRVRIIAHDRERARDGNAGAGELHGAFGIARGHAARDLVVAVGAVGRDGLHGEQAGTGEQHAQHAHVEAMPQAPAAKEGHGHDEQQDQRGKDDGANDLRLPREILEKLEEEEEVPLGACCRELLGRVGGGAQRGAMFAHRKPQHGGEHGETGHRIPQHLLGPEAFVGLANGLFGGEAVPPEEVHVSHDEQTDGQRHEPGVQREEARERVVAVAGATHEHGLQCGANARAHAHEIRGDGRAPVAVLVPRQQVAGERQRQHEQQQRHAEPEVHFARGLVRPVDDHLHEVQHQQHGHGLGGEVVDAAQQPAAPHLVLNPVDTLPGRLGAGAVGHPQDQPGDDLHCEEEGEGAPPHVPPAGAAGDVLEERLVQQSLVAGPVVQPGAQSTHQTATRSGEPFRKFWNFTHTSPFRTTASKGSMPRGLGLLGSAMLPSRAKLLLWQGQK